MLEGVRKLGDYRIMHKLSGRQNTGNHPIKTTKRKKKAMAENFPNLRIQISW